MVRISSNLIVGFLVSGFCGVFHGNSWLPVVVADGTAFQPKIDETSKSELFEIAHEIAVLAPSQFPKPTRKLNDTNVVPVVEPTFGKHRPEQDVVMVR